MAQHWISTGVIAYLCVGVVIAALRIVHECLFLLMRELRKWSADNRVSVTRGAMTLLVCTIALIAMAIMFWPDMARRVLRKWWAQ